MSRPLTGDEIAAFEYIQAATGRSITLVQTQFDDIETAVICAIGADENESTMFPLAVLVNDEIMSRLANPMEEA